MKIVVVTLLAIAALARNGAGILEECNSPIYCGGPLLHTVQLAHIYDDSKTFVDKKQRQSEAETLNIFDNLLRDTKGKPTKDQIKKFVDDAFEDGGELEDWTAPDFNPNPALLDTIKDPELRSWASDLNHLWKNLTRKMKKDIQQNQERYSIIYVPNGFVVPGGRFREFYYWDTYWIMQGILQCELYVTARGVIENFLSMVDKVGFVPNGGRVYYLTRSQPPMLTPMMKSYVDATQDVKFFQTASATLEKEYKFWMSERTVQVEKDGINYTMARYFTKADSPRPESYREDYELAQKVPEANRKKFYQDIRSAAESGWDFSTRWFINSNGTNEGNLSTIHTQSIVPVDLNAFLHWNAVCLSELFAMSDQPDRALHYKQEAARWLAAVTAVLWHEDLGVWLDYDVANKKRRNYFYLSNLTPLFANCYNKDNSASIAKKVMRYLDTTGVLSHMGGLPVSLVNSGEQWDLPNAWPPINHMAIVGLQQTDFPPAQDLALQLAQRWVQANYMAYADKKQMYEKYDAVTPGAYGGGGEYAVQAGFGWTNGIILDLLAKYGNRLKAHEANAPSKRPDHCLCSKTKEPRKYP